MTKSSYRIRCDGKPRTVPKHVSPAVRQFFIAMIAEGFTYAELARRAGCGPQTILNWRYRKNPTLPVFEAACGVLGLRVTIAERGSGKKKKAVFVNGKGWV